MFGRRCFLLGITDKVIVARLWVEEKARLAKSAKDALEKLKAEKKRKRERERKKT